MDPATKCSNCGATPPADSRHCPYCEAHLATLRCDRCFAQSVEGDRHCRACGHLHGAPVPAPSQRPDHVLECPRCENTLRMTAVGDITFDDCEHCGGVWLDLSVFEQHLSRQKEDGKSALLSAVQGLRPARATSATARPESGNRFYVPCPHCNTVMDRRQFARISRVVIDVCQKHGIWLDHDELPRILRFVAEGGLEEARQHEIRRRVDELIQRRSNNTRPLMPTPLRLEPTSAVSGVDLVSVLAGILSAFES